MATTAAADSATGHARRIRVALKHDECGCAGGMRRREQRPGRERADDRVTSTASELPRSSSTAVMLSAHCSNVGSAPGVTGSDTPMPGCVEENEPTQRCHRLDPPLSRGQLRKKLTGGEPVRDEPDVASARGRRAVGDAQVPVQRITRLREHGGSVSRGARQDSVSTRTRRTGMQDAGSLALAVRRATDYADTPSTVR